MGSQGDERHRINPMLRRLLNISRLALGFAVALATLPCSAQKPGRPERLWVVGPLTHIAQTEAAKLSGPSPELIQTGTAEAATRSVVFSGHRVVLVADLGLQQRQGQTTPVDVTELISLDAATGAVKNTREFTNLGTARLFATDDAHVILAGTNVFRLTPDLRDAGTFDPHANGHKHGRIRNISPSGSTLGYATEPGFELVDAHTLQPAPLSNAAIDDTSVSSKGVLTDNLVWTGFPLDDVTDYIDTAGDHHLYHGRCGESPVFLTDDLVLEQGCKDPLILNLEGETIRTLALKLPWSYAGVSQNGNRFALQIQRPGTLFSSWVESFEIYSVATDERVAEVKPERLPLEQSWTAFSPDGHLFVVGSLLKLALYRLP